MAWNNLEMTDWVRAACAMVVIPELQRNGIVLHSSVRARINAITESTVSTTILAHYGLLPCMILIMPSTQLGFIISVYVYSMPRMYRHIQVWEMSITEEGKLISSGFDVAKLTLH